jgi:hypothetical protein
MKSISQIFKGNEHLMDLHPVEELIDYTVELEGQVLEKKIEDTYDKEHILKTMLSDILSSCKEYEQNKILKDRYPELYSEIDADSLVKNLMSYIITMNAKNDLRL